MVSKFISKLATLVLMTNTLYFKFLSKGFIETNS